MAIIRVSLGYGSDYSTGSLVHSPLLGDSSLSKLPSELPSARLDSVGHVKDGHSLLTGSMWCPRYISYKPLEPRPGEPSLPNKAEQGPIAPNSPHRPDSAALAPLPQALVAYVGGCQNYSPLLGP